MTLLVYKDGVLAADNGCTRNGSREQYHKIKTVEARNHFYVVAYAGETDSIEAHHQDMMRRAKADLDMTRDYPILGCRGIAVKQDLRTGDHHVFTFNCFEEARGRGVWCPEHTNFIAEGWDEAVLAATAMVEVAPNLTAPQIIHHVSKVHNSCDVKYGIDWVNIPEGFTIASV